MGRMVTSHSLLILCVQLFLRSINTAKSAFFAVILNAVFFDHYELVESQLVQSAVLLKVRCDV
jgi:hypothetical protein